MYRTVFWTLWEKERVGWFGRRHWNVYNIIYETNHQSRFDARYWMLGAGALGWPRGMVRGGKREKGSGWGTRVYLWLIHVDIWQNQYNIVKLKNKIKIEKNNKFPKDYKKINDFRYIDIFCVQYISYIVILCILNN